MQDLLRHAAAQRIQDAVATFRGHHDQICGVPARCPDDLLDESPEDEGPLLQFSLRDVMILMAAAGISLGAVRLLSAPFFALVAGGGTLLFLLVAREHQMSAARFRAITVGLLTVYLIAMIGAIVQSAWAS